MDILEQTYLVLSKDYHYPAENLYEVQKQTHRVPLNREIILPDMYNILQQTKG